MSFDNSGGVMLDGRTATLTLAGGASSTAGDTRLAGTLVTRGTPLTLAAVEVFDDLALSTGGGALTTAALTAGTNDVVIDAAGGSVTTGAVSSGADVVISAATTALASFGVDGAVSIDATGIAIDGDSRADAGVTFGGATMLSGNLTTVGTPITVMPGRRLTLGDSVRLASGGGDISADAIDGGGFALELMPEDGRIDVGEIAAAGSLLASGTGIARLGSVEASGRVELALAELRLGQRVTGGSIVLDGPVSMTDATVALTSTAGTLNVNGEISGSGALALSATDSIVLGSDIGSATAPVGEVTARGASIAAQQLFASGSIALDADDVRVRRIDTPAGLQLGNRLTVAGRVDISAGSADIASVRGTPDANDALTITAQQGFEVPGADASLESLMVVSTAGSLTLNSPVALGGNTFIGVSEGDFTVNANIDNAAGNVEIFTGGAFVQDPASIITSPAGFVRIAANSGMLIGTIDARNIYLTLTGTGSSFQRAKVGIDLSNDLIAADSVIFTSSVPVDVGTQTNTFGIRATSSAFLVGAGAFQPDGNGAGAAVRYLDGGCAGSRQPQSAGGGGLDSERCPTWRRYPGGQYWPAGAGQCPGIADAHGRGDCPDHGRCLPGPRSVHLQRGELHRPAARPGRVCRSAWRRRQPRRAPVQLAVASVRPGTADPGRGGTAGGPR